MAEQSTGLRRALTLAPVYSAFQRAVGDHKHRKILVGQYIRPTRDDRVLDMGCGPASMLEYVEPAEYVGFDPSENYIENARRRYGDRGTFLVGDAATLGPERLRAPFSIVLAIGVLHHIDDAAARQTLATAWAMLQPGGRLITVDCCLHPGQHPVARFLIERDRGQNVRTRDEVEALYDVVPGDPVLSIRHDMLRIPYTHVIVKTASPMI